MRVRLHLELAGESWRSVWLRPAASFSGCFHFAAGPVWYARARMGLMTGTGPLGRDPAGTFNFEAPSGRALYMEPCLKWVRVDVGGATIADSRRTLLLSESGHQPTYYFPPEDVRADVLEASERHTRCPKKGEASYHTIRVGDHVVENGAWHYPEPLEGAAPLKDL